MENEMVQIGNEVIVTSNCGGFLEPKRYKEEFGEDSLKGIVTNIDFSSSNPYEIALVTGYKIWLTWDDFEIKGN